MSFVEGLDRLACDLILFGFILLFASLVVLPFVVVGLSCVVIDCVSDLFLVIVWSVFVVPSPVCSVGSRQCGMALDSTHSASFAASAYAGGSGVMTVVCNRLFV